MSHCYNDRSVGTKRRHIVGEYSECGTTNKNLLTSIGSSLENPGATEPNNADSLFAIRCTHGEKKL